MTQVLEIRGLPASLAQDSWWLEEDETQTRADHDGRTRKPWTLALIGLVALADVLFYGHPKGLSLVIFAAAILAAAWGLRSPMVNWRGPVVLFTLGCLPVIEHVQALSVLFLILGLIGSLAWLTLGDRATLAQITWTSSLILRSVPLRGVRELWSRRQWVNAPPSRSVATYELSRYLRAWGFPVGGLLILSALLIEANPLLLRWTEALDLGTLDLEPILLRLLFWTGMALLLWPLMVPPAAEKQNYPRRPRPLSKLLKLQTWGINQTSVGNALILFNAGLAVQTVMDALYLWGGAGLPDGMTYSTYAHRGAYPLLVTALLAGAFALAARPYLSCKSWIKPLLLLWLAQNVALVLSSLLRLELYTSVYGLTYLRVHAAIWMGLVAVGLTLVAWQVWRANSNLWLVSRCAALGLGVLYACAFVNFAEVIARSNLSRVDTADVYYACQLGPMAAVALQEVSECDVVPPTVEGWRDWGFRSVRVLDSLAAMEIAPDQAGISHDYPRR